MGKRNFHFFRLEDRVLLSGEGLAPALDLIPDATIVDGLQADAEALQIDLDSMATAALAAAGETLPTDAEQTLSGPAISDLSDPADGASALDPALPIEVIFVDAAVDDSESLIAGLRESGEDRTQWLIVHLDTDTDGIEQVTRTLASLSSVDAVHLLSQGDDEGIQLGNARLDIQSVPGYAGALASWGQALDPGADLLIYGSDLASTAAGRELIEQIAAVCDSAAAATNDDLDDLMPRREVWVPRQELAFVDTSIQGYQRLVDDLLSNSDASRHIEVVLLDTSRDGIAQISEALAVHDGLDSVHVISHGHDGGIQLGSTWVNSETLATEVAQIRTWGDALALEGDLLFYGCDFASNPQGQLLIGQFSSVTGADVAASIDLTGHQVLGGDWDLEYQVGSIETDVAFSIDLQQTWTDVLDAAVNATSTGTSGGGAVTVSHTAAGADRLMLVGVSLNQAVNETVSSVTYGGQSLTRVGYRETGDARVEIWSLVAPNLGTANVQVNFSGVTDGNTVGVMTFTGVDQSNPLGTFASNAAGSGSTASTTVSSAVDDLVFAVVAVDEPTDYNLVPGAPQTERWDLTGGGQINGGGSTQAGAASVGVQWTWSGNDAWAIGGVSINSAVITPGSQYSVAHTLTVDTISDVQDGDTTSIDALLANRGADGLISLREAIIAANNTQNDGANPDQINFAIAGTGVHTINVGSSFEITDAVSIDATTDDSFATNGHRPAIILDGNDTAADGFKLTSTADGSVIRGFVIRNFTTFGVEIDAGSDGNTIAGNYIGRLTATGSDAGAGFGNGSDGIRVYGDNTIIGGLTAADRNVISGNASDGIRIGGYASGTIVRGNYIGTNAAGTVAIGNVDDGVKHVRTNHWA